MPEYLGINWSRIIEDMHDTPTRQYVYIVTGDGDILAVFSTLEKAHMAYPGHHIATILRWEVR